MSEKPDDSPEVRRGDRILVFMTLGMGLLALACFAAIIIGGAVGVDDYETPLWQTVFATAQIAPVVALLLMIAVLVVSFIRRGRANRR